MLQYDCLFWGCLREYISLAVQHAVILQQCNILRLDHNYITSESINILDNSLHNDNTLIGSILYANRLSDKGAELLAEILNRNTTLIILWLDCNCISDEGVRFIANTLVHHNTTVQELCLKKNKLIGSLSVSYFIDIFQHNQSLTQLDMSNCSFKEEANQRLQDILN
ncbi:unnamed protein product [Rotaria magnacalcarata]|uniref:Uncharacterized protein n=1 Tax=Rotaria magnacalcarata TaxID=392030 RepID=A0A8S2QLJ4_9BILA|nr:unnamed protein product [Rotaria magnacalcarata]